VHGFLTLCSLEGKKLADGELMQVARGGRVHSHLVFRFEDGSLYDDEAEFTQEGDFRLVSDHLVAKGPSFKKATDTLIDVPKGEVTVRYKDDHGQEKVLNQKIDLPSDLSNGLLFILAKNIKPTVPLTAVSLLAATPKPRIVKLVISPAGEKPVTSGKTHLKATVYNIKVHIGGVTGMLAKLTGKQPPDMHIWVLENEAPAFIQSEGPLYEQGPVWRINLTSPSVSANPQ
jgi:hypothetical protein